MKAKGKFISFLLVVDTFFVAYAYGFHSRQVLVVDPKLPPVVPRKEVQKKVAEKTAGTKNSKTAKIIKGDGKASTSAEKAGAAALTKKPGLKQPTAKDKAASKSASTKPAAKKLVKKTSAPAIKAKDP